MLTYPVASAILHRAVLGRAAHGRLPEWPKGAVCKTVGTAYVGSNPTPATPWLTARWLRKHGPAGDLLLVASRSRLGHCGSTRGSGYGHIAASVRARLAVRITARLVDPCPFCPIIEGNPSARTAHDHPGPQARFRPGRGMGLGLGTLLP